MMLTVLTTDHLLLYGSILAVLGLFLSKTGFRFGLPTLLLFLGVGMAAGATGFINFDNPVIAQTIGSVALVVILFSGGMDTSFKEVKPIMAPGGLLATVGVLLTALFTGTFIYFLFQWLDMGIKLTFLQSLLFASVMSSTDSASVFSILRSKRTNLKQNLKPLLEFESGSNDPMAYMLTMVLIQMISQGDSVTIWDGVWMFVVQFSLGLLLGFLLGKGAIWLVNRANLYATSLYPILMLFVAFFIYSITNTVQGNGYLAVYVGGLVIGNSRMQYSHTIAKFFDGMQWLSQLVMFLTLGLLVDVPFLLKVALPALYISLFMLFFGRPLSVFLTLLPFWGKFSAKAQLYTSWVGLRGAVPIIFAISPWVAGLEHAQLTFTIVFFITILSLLIQGTTVHSMADKLDLIDYSVRENVFTDINLPQQIKSAISEIIVNDQMLSKSDMMRDLELPDHTLAIMVQREGQFFIPRGHTQLRIDDHVLFISDDQEALVQAYEELGVNIYSMDSNA
ncbi:potassium/proton antiporter [uncultured Porphyromonas sp.]|uniref:potassium/proton antiporter n=1 Tax=uncultured Porphyromonas sp. TaxID=159274 RepID=UPI0026089182|nr:potassium/proton antiporter [uncultured Porphyromonas sp.]